MKLLIHSITRGISKNDNEPLPSVRGILKGRSYFASASPRPCGHLSSPSHHRAVRSNATENFRGQGLLRRARPLPSPPPSPGHPDGTGTFRAPRRSRTTKKGESSSRTGAGLGCTRGIDSRRSGPPPSSHTGLYAIAESLGGNGYGSSETRFARFSGGGRGVSGALVSVSATSA